MANPNARLQAIVEAFAGQPNVTPAEVAQLRAAIASDDDLARSLERQAANGHLIGFALEQPAYNPSLIGTYDAKTGIVTLPISAFQPTNSLLGHQLVSSLRLQEMSIRLLQTSAIDSKGVTHAVSPGMVVNLQSTINESPVLAEQIGKLMSTPDPTDPKHRLLENFYPLVDTIAGGTYDGQHKTMKLPLTSLSRAVAGSNDRVDLTFVLGHEVQHGFNHPDTVAAWTRFAAGAGKIARSNGPHDYTAVISEVIEAGRRNEASANLAGWNSLLSREQAVNPNAGLLEMWRTRNSRVLDFIEQDPVTKRVEPRPGLVFNHDHALSATAANIAAEAGYYFDKKPKGTPGVPTQDTVGLGYRGDSDYPNVYGANAVSNVINIERHFARRVDGKPTGIHIDMAAVRLSEPLLEHNGIAIRIDPGVSQPYYDSSQSPPALHHFDNTVDRANPRAFHNYLQKVAPQTEPMGQGMAEPAMPSPPAPAGDRRGPDDPAHPDHAMLEQIRAGVRRIDEGIGKPYDAMSERISRCLLAACKDDRDMYPDASGIRPGANALRRVDHVVMGETGNIFAVEGRLQDPAHKRAFVGIEQAISTPVEQSDGKLEAANRVIAGEQSLVHEQVQAQMQAMESHGHGVPMIAR